MDEGHWPVWHIDAAAGFSERILMPVLPLWVDLGHMQGRHASWEIARMHAMAPYDATHGMATGGEILDMNWLV